MSQSDSVEAQRKKNRERMPEVTKFVDKVMKYVSVKEAA